MVSVASVPCSIGAEPVWLGALVSAAAQSQKKSRTSCFLRIRVTSGMCLAESMHLRGAAWPMSRCMP